VIRRVLLAACCLLFLIAQRVSAHDARPLSVSIIEQQERTYRVDVRMPPSIESSNRPNISFPEGCMVHTGGVREVTDAWAQTLLVACSGLREGLAGQRIAIHYTLFNPSLSTLIRFIPAVGGTRTAVLAPDQTEWSVPPSVNWRTVARDYLLLGIEHIWAGVDHLLFVTGLLLLARTPRRIAIAVTGFTLAHSATLSASALGLVRLPSPPIEAGIALSILFVAREIVRPGATTLARRHPLAISSFFGLLHGFGFAAALREAGLPRNEIAVALLLFNTGVEVGQLLFIFLVLGVIAVVFRLTRTPTPVLSRAESLAAYGLGIPAAFWFFERLEAFW